MSYSIKLITLSTFPLFKTYKYNLNGQTAEAVVPNPNRDLPLQITHIRPLLRPRQTACHQTARRPHVFPH